MSLSFNKQYFHLETAIPNLAGKWKQNIPVYVWTCVKMSSTNFKCNGLDYTQEGLTVTLVHPGYPTATGTFVGGNLINWARGVHWVKEQEQGNQTIVYRN